MTKRKLRYSGLALAVFTVGAIAACSSDNNEQPSGGAGNNGTGGAHTGGAAGTTAAAGTSTAGTSSAGTSSAGTGTGGASGSGAGGSAGFTCANTAPTSSLITDFSNLVPSSGQYTFAGGVLGGTFTYQANHLTINTGATGGGTGGAAGAGGSGGSSAAPTSFFNVKGNIKDYDGFGLYFNSCYDALTPGYTGVSFTVKGYAGPTGKLNFRVQTNANTAVDATNMKGQCVPTNPAMPYPDCHASAVDINVGATATTVTVNFSQLKDGLPVPAVTGKDVVGLEWAFTKPAAPAAGGAGAGGASGSGGAGGGSAGKGGSGGAAGGGVLADGSYDADITIDDVKFLGGTAGGAGGAGAGGGSSAGSGGASGGTGGGSGGTGGGGKAGSGGKAGTGG